MHNLSTASLQSLHELMTRMSKAIEQADWDGLMNLDRERRETIEGFIASGSAANDKPGNDLSKCTDSESERQNLSAQIKALDRELLQTLKHARQQLVTTNHENSAQQNAAAGYAQASSFI